MPIQIIDNFELGTAKPIDSRFVVGPGQFYTNKDLIPYKYTGMRVWDLNIGINGTPYVWIGTTFSSESSGGISGSGTINQVPKFTSPTSLVDSIITDNGSRVGIGTYPSINLGLPPYNTHRLVVNGSIYSSTGGFHGNGTFISDINASNISSGQLQLARLENSPTGRILISGGSQPEWTDRVKINTAPSTSAINGENNYIYFRNYTGTTTRIYSYNNNSLNEGEFHIQLGTTRLKIVEDSGGGSFFDFNKQVRLSTASNLSQPTTPALSFAGSTNTGIYKLIGSSSIGFSTSGSLRMTISTTVGIGASPNAAYALLVNGGSSYPLYVSDVSSKSAYFVGSVGIMTAPNATYPLSVNSTSNRSAYFVGSVGIGIAPPSSTYKLEVNGSIKSGDIHIGSPSQKYHSLVTSGSADIQGGLSMNIGFNTGNWRASSSTPGLMLFYQTYASINKYVLYVNSSASSGSIVTPKEVMLIDPSSSAPDVEFTNGILVGDNVGIGTSTFAWTTSGNRFHEGSNTLWSTASNGTSKLAVNGGISCTWIVTLSDRRLKKNITPINTSLDKVLKLNAVEYEWNEHTDVKNYGFIAQEVEEIIPEVIRYYEDDELEGGKMTIHYESIIAHLTKAIQEQQEIINSFEERLKKLE